MLRILMEWSDVPLKICHEVWSIMQKCYIHSYVVT